MVAVSVMECGWYFCFLFLDNDFLIVKCIFLWNFIRLVELTFFSIAGKLFH